MVITRADTIERDSLQLAFHHATMVLHRPSPSFPIPAAPVLDICLGAARGVIRVSEKIVAAETEQDVMPGWAGLHSVFMAGLTLLYCSW